MHKRNKHDHYVQFNKYKIPAKETNEYKILFINERKLLEIE